MKFEEWLSQQTGYIEVDCGCVTTEAFYHWIRIAYEAGNSPEIPEGSAVAALTGIPMIPDGYVMVPREPTEDMVIAGFESRPDEFFSEPDAWEAYQKMSGCQQAAHRAKLCWAAMIAAAPQEVEL